MHSINALSLTSAINDWLANSRYPRILHIFDRACNLINERREVLSIVTPQIGNGPFNLVVEDNVCFSDYLSLESSISLSPKQLNLGDLTINATDAKIWCPRPDWERLHSERNNIFNQLPITNYQALLPNSLTLAPGAHLSDLLGKSRTVPGSAGVSNLCSSLAKTDLPSSLIAAKKLAGLGVGLTPSGDDFIMGAIYAIWIIDPVEVASVLAHEIANATAPLTTSLSAAWLRSAGKGEAGILWHQFFDVLISSESGQIQNAIDKILAVGETSGVDALAGFLKVLMADRLIKPASA